MEPPLKTRYTVTILQEGHRQQRQQVLCVSGMYESRGSCSLITGPHTVLVGTGSPHNSQDLLQALKQLGVSPDSVQYVVCTHGHPQDVGNLNLFPHATHIVGNEIMRQGVNIVHDFSSDIPYEIDEDVCVVASPGYVASAVAVIVKNSNLSTLALAGSTFMTSDDLDTPELWVDESSDADTQQQSRIAILTEATNILPRYGPVFPVPDEFKRQMSVVMTP